MSNGTVIAICISPTAGGQLQNIESVVALAGKGLEGDRYCSGEGSFNKGNVGKRQVTLMNAQFFEGTSFSFADSRRNIFTEGVELMDLIGKEFTIGDARMRGVKYCDPCARPSKLSGNTDSFREAFFDRGGLVAEIIKTGVLAVGDKVIPPKKTY